MKKTLTLFSFFLFFFLLSQLCFAQNLVPNPSFEDTTACPFNSNQINFAAGWSIYRESPDYFNSCNNALVGVPSNLPGYQFARTGNAYAGFISYARYAIDFREFLGIQLSQQLIIGQVYYISFYLNRAVGNIQHNNIATNKIGVRLTTNSYSYTNPISIDGYSQVYTDSIVGDTLNWIRISGSFIADSAYSFISIGNYFSDSATSHISFDTSAALAYYYVDDICVSTDSLVCSGEIIKDINEIPDVFSFKVFPSPASHSVNIILPSAINKYEIILRNIFGMNLLQQEVSSSKIILDTSTLITGIYFIELKINGTSQTKKIIINN